MSEAGVVAPVRFGPPGSPNSGKTTLFNALTGLHVRVGNYPGVTVERRETNSWRWPIFAFGYLLTLAYVASFSTYRVMNALA